MGVGNANHINEGKGVCCEAESEGSRRQIPELMDTNSIQGIFNRDKFTKQNEVQKLPGD